jgi:hypothetical protein
MNNGDLAFDLEKIKGFDAPITIAKAFDENLDVPFAIDVEDGSYFYGNEAERDADYEALKEIVPQFEFID